MTAPLLGFTNCCCAKLKVDFEASKCTLGNKLALTAVAFDTLVSISALVLGILGAVSVIAMPAAAAYSLIGLSGGITLLWVGFIIKLFTCREKQFPCFEPAKANHRFVHLHN